MKLLSKILPRDHNLFFFGDLHDGSVLSSKHGWERLIDMMHSEYEGCSNNYGSEGGDDIEAIMVDDKRFDPEKLTQPLPLEQIDRAVELRQPIKDMMICKLMGNHERKLWRFGDITEAICKKLEVPYGTYTAKIIIKDKHGRLMYKIYVTHGFKNITSTADDPKRRQVHKQLILKRQLKFKAGDCAVMIKHHTHKLIVCKPESELYLTDDGEKIKQAYTGFTQSGNYIHPDARWYGNAGSFLKLYGKGISGYAEIMEYDPTELGFLILRCRDRHIVGLDPIYLQI